MAVAIVIVVVAVVLVVGGFVAFLVWNRKRRAALQAWATTQGWTYQEGGGGGWLQYLPTGSDEGIGGPDLQGVREQLDGVRAGRPVTVADYFYKTITVQVGPAPGTQGSAQGTQMSRTRSTKVQDLAVVVVGLTRSHPVVELRPRIFGGLGIGVAKAVGRQPKNLTGAEKFDHHYHVHAGAAMLTPDVIKATLDARLPAWQVQGEDLIIPWTGQHSAGNLDQRIDQAIALANLLDAPARLLATRAK